MDFHKRKARDKLKVIEYYVFQQHSNFIFADQIHFYSG